MCDVRGGAGTAHKLKLANQRERDVHPLPCRSQRIQSTPQTVDLCRTVLELRAAVAPRDRPYARLCFARPNLLLKIAQLNN